MSGLIVGGTAAAGALGGVAAGGGAAAGGLLGSLGGLGGVGSLLGGAGGLFGSVFGGGKGSWKKQMAAAHAFESQRIRMMAKDAKLAGIHPLAALGVAASYQNPMMAVPSGGFSNAGSKAGSAAQSLGQAMIDFGNAKKSKKLEAIAAENALRVADLEERRVRVQEANAATDRMLAEAQLNQMKLESARLAKGGRYGSPSGPALPSMVKYVNPKTGEEHLGTSREVTDLETRAGNWFDRSPFRKLPDIEEWERDARRVPGAVRDYSNARGRNETLRGDLVARIKGKFKLTNAQADRVVRLIDKGVRLERAIAMVKE